MYGDVYYVESDNTDRMNRQQWQRTGTSVGALSPYRLRG
jgi:hypothetical protein